MLTNAWQVLKYLTTHVAVGENQWDPILGWAHLHFRTYFSGWIGMFTGTTIWVLTHGHVAMEPDQVPGRQFFGRWGLC